MQEAKFTPTRKQIEGTLVGGDKVKVNYLNDLSAFEVEKLLKQGEHPYDSKGKGSSWWSNLLISLLPFALLIGFWIFLMNQVQGGGSKVMSFGKSRAKRMTPDSPKIGFKDVAGVDEAVEELHEIKEFLENPKKFQALGARIPRASCCTGPRYRQDAARARRRRRGRRPVLLHLRPGLRRDVRRRRRFRVRDLEQAARSSPASSSWTRSTPSAATAAPASAAVTTSASRR